VHLLLRHVAGTLAGVTVPADASWSGFVTGLRIVAGIAGAVALVPVVVSLVMRQVAVDRPRLVAYVSATPFVVLGGLAAVVLFALARTRIGVAVAAVLTIVLALSQVPLYLGTASAAPGSTPLTVMTLNMHYGEADPQAVVAAVRDHRVDVLATVEMTQEAVDALQRAGIDDLLPFRDLKARGGSSGVGVWSRLPLTHVDTPGDYTHQPVSTTLDYHGRPIFFSAVHPLSPYPANAAQWSDEMGRMAEWLRDVRGLAVVAGDFNATRDHKQFRDILDAGFADAATQAGAGWQPTYPANRRRLPLLIAIDHVLVQGGIVATKVDRLDIPDTDHAGLVATLMIPPPSLVDDGK
jgi:endonuclease/exonuclease/phosphatase (EEP) superfamily protein YafD